MMQPEQLEIQKQPSKVVRLLGGIGFTVLIALAGTLLALLPIFEKIGPLASAIFIAVLYRQFFGFPHRIEAGIAFSSKTLLRLAIVLYGLKLNISLILQEGVSVLVRGGIVIIFSIAFMLLIAKWLKADLQIALLLGIGTGICGAAAIAAAAPILQAKEEDTAAGVGMIALVGTIFAVLYTVLFPILPLSEKAYALWSGISLHEIAHVALAAAPAGQEALALSLLAKLGRVLLLIPVCFILMYWKKRNSKDQKEAASIPFPWFLLGFIIMSIVGTIISEKQLATVGTLDSISKGTTFILTMAMTGLGLNIHLKTLREKALRPLIALMIVSVVLSVLTYFSVFI